MYCYTIVKHTYIVRLIGVLIIESKKAIQANENSDLDYLLYIYYKEIVLSKYYKLIIKSSICVHVNVIQDF